MKVLTLTQPWAMLVAVGAKRYETRSWATPHRGTLAIHAAKGFPREAQDLVLDQPFSAVLAEHGITDPEQLPRGVIVAKVKLVDILPTDGFLWEAPPVEPALFEPIFGNYRPGRFAWALADVEPVDPPVPARGHLSLWDFAGRV